MSCYTINQIEKAVKDLNYDWFESGDYNVNIVGVRNLSAGFKVTNKFDDCMTVSYKVDGDWKFHCYKCTTDPGTHWVENIIRKEGVAVLKEGQYKSSHKLRLHQGKYLALGQQKPVTVYRDNNRDDNYDLDEKNTQTGLFGINIHRATGRSGKTSSRVDRWSAGCQVIASNDDWHEFLDICQTAREVWGNSFTYTLINSKNIS